jgi:hypothetical protein
MVPDIFRKRWRRLRRQPRFIVFAAVVLSFVLSFMWFLYFGQELELGSPKTGAPQNRPSYQSVQRTITEGDRLYRARQYRRARRVYDGARQDLNALIHFEQYSPLPEKDLLQAFYNTGTTLKVKTRLAEIGADLDFVRARTMQEERPR